MLKLRPFPIVFAMYAADYLPQLGNTLLDFVPRVILVDSSMKEEIRMTVHLDNENFPQIETVFYRYDGTNCLATVDGEPFAYITRDKVVDLIEAVHGIVLK